MCIYVHSPQTIQIYCWYGDCRKLCYLSARARVHANGNNVIVLINRDTASVLDAEFQLLFDVG